MDTGKNTEPLKPARTLEQLHRHYFAEPDRDLEQILRSRRELRSRRLSQVETVVTYGAYEDPI